jgi:hypothetical protein
MAARQMAQQAARIRACAGFKACAGSPIQAPQIRCRQHRGVKTLAACMMTLHVSALRDLTQVNR